VVLFVQAGSVLLRHRAPVDIGAGILAEVWPPAVEVGAVVVRLDAPPRLGVGVADGGDAVRHGDAVGAGIGAEVAVERAILLHDNDDVLDLVDAARDERGRMTGVRRLARLGATRDDAYPGGEAHEHGGRDDRSHTCPRVPLHS
jgi:hypothetical protein